MNMSELMEQMRTCAIFFYQNREEEAYNLFGQLLPYINAYMQTCVNGEETAAEIITQMQVLIEAYQRKDQLALADWLYIETVKYGITEEFAVQNVLHNSDDVERIKEENEKALYEVWGENYTKYDAFMIDENGGYCLEETIGGETIIGVIRDGYEYRLNSIYGPQRAAKQHAQRYEIIKNYSLIGVLGLSDGRAIREVLEYCNDTHTLIIYEPDANLFKIAMRHFYLADIILHKNVILIVEGINSDDLSSKLNTMINFYNKDLLGQCILPNYDILYQEKGIQFINQMVHCLKTEVFDRNTLILHASKVGDNLMKNLPYVLKQSSVDMLKKHIKEEGYNNCPVIVVSAGPSLDKNIAQLKRAEGKALIIGVDSALQALVSQNVDVNLAISVDPNKNPELFEDERLNKLPYVISSFSLPIITHKNKNRLFFEGGHGFDVFERLIYKKTGKTIGRIKTGGSVATDAFSLAVLLGFKTIILVGQDLAFTEGRDHVSGFKKSNANFRTDEMLVEVEGFNGEILKTDFQMAHYKEWFESEIANLPKDINVIDATEGGAKICGTQIMKLKEAIESYCTTKVDYNKVIAEVPYLLDQAEEVIIRNEMLQIEERLKELEEHISDGIMVYEQLIQMEKEGRQGNPEYKSLLKKVAKINSMEEKEEYLKLARLYAKATEYTAVEDIYVAEELSVCDIAGRGKALLEGYLEGAKDCCQKAQEILVPGLMES